MADPKEILSQYEDRPPDEDGFLFSTRNGELKFNPWEAVKNFMGSGHAPGYLSTSGDTKPITAAADTAGWLGLSGLGLNWAGAAPANAAGVFGGRLGAKTLAEQGIPAPQKALELAERMKAAGASRDEIWRETAALMEREDPRFSGVHYGKDYLPRFEIPDKDARWPEHMLSSYERRQEAVTRPGETLEHPLLYSAYPEMRDVAMRGVARSRVPMEGSFDSVLTMPGDLSRAKIEAYGSTPERARQAALHELQHATQFKENHNRGSNPARAEPIYDGSPVLMSMRDDLTQLHKRYDERLNDPSRPIEGFYDDPEVKWMLSEMDRINKELYPAARMEGYRRSAGETEARNVEKRARMTPEQLRARPPWETQDVPDAQQILEMYGTSGGPQRKVETDLPMDEASRLARAKEMGFDTDNVWYHGTDARPFDEFKAGLPSKRYMAFVERDVNSQGHFFSPNPEDAGSYGKNVGDYYVRSERPLVPPTDVPVSTRDPASMDASKKAWDDFMHIMEPLAYEQGGTRYIDTDGGVSRMPFDPGDWAHYIDWNWLDNPEVVARMRARGYDSAHVAEPNDYSGRSLFVLDPSQVRSTKAAFDPAKKDSGNLLAASGVPVTTGDILKQYEEKDGTARGRADGGGVDDYTPRKVYGYEVRNPYETEQNYFRQNPHVTGMAAEDGKITLNPYSPLEPHEQDAVARNEAARLYMREHNFDFDFDPTPEQQQSFDGTAYANDPHNMRATILGRIISGDPSAGQTTPKQREWADWLLLQLQNRR